MVPQELFTHFADLKFEPSEAQLRTETDQDLQAAGTSCTKGFRPKRFDLGLGDASGGSMLNRLNPT